MRKINSNKGETLVETLTAIVIATLAIMLLTTSVISAAKINKKTSEMDVLFNTTETQTEETVKVIKSQFAGDYQLNIIRHNTDNDFSYWQTTGDNYPRIVIIDEDIPDDDIEDTMEESRLGEIVKKGHITNSRTSNIVIPAVGITTSHDIYVNVYLLHTNNIDSDFGLENVAKVYESVKLNDLWSTIVKVDAKTVNKGSYVITFAPETQFTNNLEKMKVALYLKGTYVSEW